MKFYFSILAIFFMFACGSQKGNSTGEKTDNILLERTLAKTIKIKITHFVPYCGGAPPTAQMEANRVQLQRNKTFLLIDLKNKSKETVKTDSFGLLNLSLAKGKYELRETYKDISFDAFLKQNKTISDSDYTTENDSCYYKWWKTNLGAFEIVKTDSIYAYSWSTRERCFTGRNPCLNYDGPLPP